MSETPSTMLPLGTQAPDFSLLECRGQRISRDDFNSAAGLLVIFLCNHCPYVKQIRQPLAKLAQSYQEKGLGIVGINSNDAQRYPADSPENMALEAAEAGYTFPYLYDPQQRVAKRYQAACTPDFFLFDDQQKLVYRGQFDASRPGNDLPTNGADLAAACDALLQGCPVNPHQTPSVGCNIKWRAGNEPDYFA